MNNLLKTNNKINLNSKKKNIYIYQIFIHVEMNIIVKKNVNKKVYVKQFMIVWKKKKKQKCREKQYIKILFQERLNKFVDLQFSLFKKNILKNIFVLKINSIVVFKLVLNVMHFVIQIMAITVFIMHLHIEIKMIIFIFKRKIRIKLKLIQMVRF